jgi:hypothetical protein
MEIPWESGGLCLSMWFEELSPELLLRLENLESLLPGSHNEFLDIRRLEVSSKIKSLCCGSLVGCWMGWLITYFTLEFLKKLLEEKWYLSPGDKFGWDLDEESPLLRRSFGIPSSPKLEISLLLGAESCGLFSVLGLSLRPIPCVLTPKRGGTITYFEDLRFDCGWPP